MIFILLLTLLTMSGAQAANILAVLPTPAYSHHLVYRAYVQALANKCHNVTVIKPQLLNYITANKQRCGFIEQIDADMSSQQYKKLVASSGVFRKRGVVSDETTVTADNYMGLVEMFRDQFDNVNVRRFLITNRTFDAVVVEAFADYALVFGHLFRPAPVIQIAPGYGMAENFDAVGAVGRHPVYYPNIWRSSSIGNADGALIEWRLYNEFELLARRSDALLKLQFGPNTPTIRQLRNNVQLLLLNLHPVYDNNRPVPPSVQYLGGGLHLTFEAPQRLENALEKRLNASVNGAVYVSFGSSIDTNSIHAEFLQMLLDTFAKLNNRTVLWKVDDAVAASIVLPPNVIAQKWFNQRAVLNHRNVVAFVTQGGLQSSDEALNARVPMVCLPMMGDQFHHSAKLQQFGVARALDTVTVTATQLALAVGNVIANRLAYQLRMTNLLNVIAFDEATPADKAIKFTERVIRFGHDITRSACSLKSPSANTDYSDYFVRFPL
ncbi:ecdysteroid UDP-glucosyltransferase precursor [Condylorrhiza vestigialis mutiple nucleopolyhedrovirus]|uniref:Ecdysteroid UDP-glucosyltransferase n=1 Tax=Condylorrhiza vestigialis mutiple nucleopolyhedrovirus TaxID=1592576 RepID=A0A0B4UM87_9ABAC|nr:ecdysteroid UDP-glucosyltransferase precursor [Condylorrhiza vestigialis mutiple nucleopolyhedrovirus]AJD09288.1 ecdysteroid UDP-glucosyltransferase precursor [Condylorrhiza vestigialis mutiple nucleopolyhedrovirus]